MSQSASVPLLLGQQQPEQQQQQQQQQQQRDGVDAPPRKRRRKNKTFAASVLPDLGAFLLKTGGQSVELELVEEFARCVMGMPAGRALVAGDLLLDCIQAGCEAVVRAVMVVTLEQEGHRLPPRQMHVEETDWEQQPDRPRRSPLVSPQRSQPATLYPDVYSP